MALKDGAREYPALMQVVSTCLRIHPGVVKDTVATVALNHTIPSVVKLEANSLFGQALEMYTGYSVSVSFSPTEFSLTLGWLSASA